MEDPKQTKLEQIINSTTTTTTNHDTGGGSGDNDSFYNLIQHFNRVNHVLIKRRNFGLARLRAQSSSSDHQQQEEKGKILIDANNKNGDKTTSGTNDQNFNDVDDCGQFEDAEEDNDDNNNNDEKMIESNFDDQKHQQQSQQSSKSLPYMFDMIVLKDSKSNIDPDMQEFAKVLQQFDKEFSSSSSSLKIIQQMKHLTLKHSTIYEIGTPQYDASNKLYHATIFVHATLTTTLPFTASSHLSATMAQNNVLNDIWQYFDKIIKLLSAIPKGKRNENGNEPPVDPLITIERLMYLYPELLHYTCEPKNPVVSVEVEFANIAWFPGVGIDSKQCKQKACQMVYNYLLELVKEFVKKN